MISGADDRVAKVWDYQTKACVQTLEGHAHNVSAVMFHPELPVGGILHLQYHASDQPHMCTQVVFRLAGCLLDCDVRYNHGNLIAQVILTGGEDGSVRIWHSTTYRLENTLNYGMERVWALAYVKGSNS